MKEFIKMNPEGASFARCVRHPSQFFTGFCSSCLVERLSIVDSVERGPKILFGPRSEIVEISSSVSDSVRKHSDVRVRRTLLSLFKMDDCNDTKNKEHDAISHVGFVGNGFACESKASTSYSGLGDVSNAACPDKKIDPLEGKNLKDTSASFWLNPMFTKVGLRWRMRGASKKSQVEERCLNGGFEDKQLESKPNFCHSCDWRVCRESRDSSKFRWEKPRHSWDGSMMNKALTCSFACLEEPQDGSCRIKRRLPEEATIAIPNRSSGTIDVSKANTMSLADEKPLSTDDSLGNLHRERHHEESHREINVSDVRRSKSHRWSKVWDWSITSPFRDFVKKREHVLERSLSESWQESRKDQNIGGVESDSGVHSYVNGLSTARTNHSLNRSINGRNGEHQKFRPDWQKKREYRFGRSRSVHYSSPGNVDNGLLRFYLTPLRTSRRSTNKGRTKTSRFFAKGILGF